MPQETPAKTTVPKPSDRQERLKAALKANLGRRKAQSRARAVQESEKTGVTEPAAAKKDN
ncbi:MAG: hypothetical protein AAF636_19670 [Pseudomonadota bacterium]